ncbi:MAG: indole-3-glycerol phosphate synthase TrpC [Candidatus Omnitrophica bacterium]|nr:indole-3-glycerol phosphate synthase TrpC [Candidatus Omnitrophota bacterium]MBI2174842.1 indole-3-glycerol phosphate synthase TrpC [Candidatus Omnitrophota bacterium]MBI3010812.1 indole-3-glycerol phosphate synthase TrpC [Candidatus Omnitrophota bacterium]
MLSEIIRHKRQELKEAKERLSLDAVKARALKRQPERDFRKAIHVEGTLSFIGELKRRSPSKGILRERFDPVSLSVSLQEAGASALSVLTDERFFGGQLSFLQDARQFTEIPILRKDFILEPYQVYESACYGADAVLLIARILSEEVLRECLKAARSIGLEALVEVHSEEDLKKALLVDVAVIGINQRDLETFTLQPQLTAELVRKIPKGKTIVAESGIHTPEEVKGLSRLGVHALLIGESLMVAPDPAAKLRQLKESLSA